MIDELKNDKCRMALIEEREAIRRNGRDEMISIISCMIHAARENKCPTFLRGNATSSRVCFERGITDIDPWKYGLNYRFFWGYKGDRDPYFEINIGSERCKNVMLGALLGNIDDSERVITRECGSGHSFCFFIVLLPCEYNKEYADELRSALNQAADENVLQLIHDYNFYKEKKAEIVTIVCNPMLEMLERLWNITGINPASDEVNIDDESLLSLINGTEVLKFDSSELWEDVAGRAGIPILDKVSFSKINQSVKASTVEEIIAVVALSLTPEVWVNYVKGRIEVGCKLNEVIAYREALYATLCNNGIDEAAAFEITEFVRKGKAASSSARWEEYQSELKYHGISNDVIDFCQQVSYLFPKAHAVAYSVNALRLMWYKLYEPEAFYEAWCQVYSGELEQYRDDIIAASADISAMERWLFEHGQSDERFYEILPLMKVVQEMILRGKNACIQSLAKAELF